MKLGGEGDDRTHRWRGSEEKAVKLGGEGDDRTHRWRGSEEAAAMLLVVILSRAKP